MEDKARLLKNINRVATVVRLHGEESARGQIRSNYSYYYIRIIVLLYLE